ALAAWQPIADERRRAAGLEALADAIARQGEPGAWCAVGRDSLAATLAPDAPDGLDGPALVLVLSWLEAARDAQAAWDDAGLRSRHAPLASLVDALPDLAALREKLAQALDGDGAVRDAASPALARARRGLREGERRLHAQLERWAAGFGEGSYVTRFGDRFVACVPAAGFPRRRGIVHDTSNSGQSLFVEPLEACAGNNDLLEQRAAALDEERRILRELATAVSGTREALLATEATLADLDALRARARWAGELGARALAPSDGPMRLAHARHPLLATGPRAAQVVPLDLELEEDGRVLLVSGPNMGGKTVLLKTVGLAVVMAHAALPVLAAEGSRVPRVRSVVVDLGDEQSVDNGLSTFAAHLARLRAMAEAAGPDALLLADELGAGTDPEEGGALGRALLEHFAATRSWAVLTTHLGSLKRAGGEVEGVVNGSLEFDRETLESRYRFIAGVPGASHALAVAARMGLPPAVLERARALEPEESRALERLLADVSDALRATLAERAALAEARARADEAAASARAAAEDSRRTLADLRRGLTAESEVLLGRARELWQSVQREARRAEKSKPAAETLRHELETVRRDAAALRDRAAEAAGLEPGDAPLPPAAITVGRRVRVLDLGIEAEVASTPDAEGRVQLKRGAWSIQSHVNRLAAVGTPSIPGPALARPAATVTPAEETPRLELDLRGMEPDEAIREVDQGLDRAVLAGFSELRIIHGIGRGVLRAAVERHLRSHPQVASQRLGQGHEGGRGVTVAALR
ncbi:MAG TPA: Smr/MutS family protein, partial [Candidatus Acidoferrales bacterium]|nr:Smr/MutS family protein [Candidatus Acidoferrales bacterium]